MMENPPPLLFSLSSSVKTHLLHLARISIQHGLEYGSPAKAQASDLEGILGNKGASFITLKKQRHLRGCIGCLEARRALAIDVLENAYASAFKDSRFPPLHHEEWEYLKIKISVLSPSVPMDFESESHLLEQLNPDKDGLILSEGEHRSTFLPSVWEELPRPHLFLGHLKRKAELPEDYWSETIKIRRYTTIEFGEGDE